MGYAAATRRRWTLGTSLYGAGLPLLFVEQRRGWGGIQAQMPYFSGVSDVRRRAIEFLLDLDVGKLEGERQRLRAQEDELSDAWRAAVRSFKDSLVGEALVTIRLPETLSVAWPPQHRAVVAESRDESWIALDALLPALRAEQERLEAEEVPRAQAVAAETEQRLREALDESDRLRQLGALIREDVLRDRDELRSVQARLEALREDLRQHEDVVTLRKLGSAELERLHGDCPVCHQQLPASLLGTDSPVRTLSPEDTVAYIRQQVELFGVMERDGERSLRAKRERYAALQAQAADVRSQIRALRSTLTAPEGTPSADVIARRIRLSDRIERLQAVAERFLELLGALDRLGEQAREIRAALAQLPSDKLSKRDLHKLEQLQLSFVDQLHDYDFSSVLGRAIDHLPRRLLAATRGVRPASGHLGVGLYPRRLGISAWSTRGRCSSGDQPPRPPRLR
jgi:DNA repair exonuclease SbcCD ATPase subunit